MAMQPPSPDAPKLLRALDNIVKSDPSRASLTGNVVVAVKGEQGAWIWHAAFASERLLGCGYLAGVPRDADAILLFNETQAADIVDGKPPTGKISTYGNHELLDAFIDRYCTFRSFVDVRASR